MIPNLKLYLYAACVVTIFGAGWYVNGVFTGHKILELEAAYANERTQSAEAARAAEQRARETEQNWILTVTRASEASAEEAKVRERSIANLRATNGKLSERIAAITKSSSSTCDTSGSCADLLQYIERAGVLVVELDDFARQAAEFSDQISDELRLCRAYVTAISGKQ